MYTLTQLGWCPFFQSQLDSSTSPSHLRPARILASVGNRYQVLSTTGQHDIWPMQGARRQPASEQPRLGDWVLISDQRIARRLSRRTVLQRRAPGRRPRPQVLAANLDVVFVLTSMNQDFNPRRIERYLAVIHAGGARPVIVINKVDLDPGGRERYLAAASEVSAGVPVLMTSALDGTGLDALAGYLGEGRTLALVGSSGVGKSSLVNRLLGGDPQRVEGIREADARGRHTTTRRELFVLSDQRGVLIDTPGMRELGLWEPAGIDAVFTDIEALARSCRYRSCRHAREPGCAVRAAVERGQLDASRLRSFHRLVKQSRRRRRA